MKKGQLDPAQLLGERMGRNATKQPAVKATAPAVQTQEAQTAQPHILVNKKEETKTKRMQLLMRPSTYNKLKSACDEAEISVNEGINQIIEMYLRGV